jgi:hypothetical protein
MPSTRRASSSIIAAGVVAILGGTLAALFNLAALILLWLSYFPLAANLPDFMRPVLYVLWIFFFLCSVFAVIVGIQVIRLKNWGRISLLVTSGCLLLFGITGIVIVLVGLVSEMSPDPLVSKSALAAVLAVIYGIPIAISLWWLALFTRPFVVEQFRSAPAVENLAENVSPAISAFRLSDPNCPLAIRVIGWYLASFVLIVPILPFVSGHFPAFYFGHIFRGPAATLILFLNFAILFIPGFGLLLLKGWSYPLTIASQLIIGANAISATFSSSYAEAIRSLLEKMALPQLSPTADKMLSCSRYFNLLSLAVPIAIVITLLLLRREFFAAAAAEVRSNAPKAIP